MNSMGLYMAVARTKGKMMKKGWRKIPKKKRIGRVVKESIWF